MTIRAYISQPRWCAMSVLVCLLIGGSGCGRDVQSELSVVTSTTMIEAVVREVGGSAVSVQSLVPGGMCPGHFDIKPGQMEDIERSDLFLYHGWETWLPRVTGVMGPQTQIVPIDIGQSWMVPDNHLLAITFVRDVLTSLEPDKQAYYTEQALKYENAVLMEAQSVCRSFRSHEGTRVICSELQVDFLTWLGFDVLGTYERAESISPKTLESLIGTGRRNQVAMVVDNKQSGPSVGAGIARETGAGHVVLTNFPVDGTYLDALRSNVEALKELLG